jgi:AcrR family transcriptional regulator
VPRTAKNTTPERREELIHAAAGLFKERGFDATSMQEIADRMGILKGSLYHYVKTKEDLLWMVMEPALRELVERAHAILSNETVPVTDRLVEMMLVHAEAFDANYPHMFVMTRENGDTLSEQRRKDLDQLRRRYFNLLRKTIRTAQESGELRDDIEPTLVVHSIFGQLNWMFRWFTPGGRMKARDVAGQFAKITISGLVPRTQ